MLNYKIIIKTLGYLLVGEGCLMFLCLLISSSYRESDAFSFFLSSAITMLVGSLFLILTRNHKSKIGKRDGLLLASLTWIVISLFSTLPYLLSHSISNFTDAFFESISGFTTTGSTVFTNIDTLSHGILFWRSLTQWIGGIGAVALTISVLPAFGIIGTSGYSTELPGQLFDKVNPRISDSIVNLFRIYIIFTGINIFLLLFGKMNLFDAICHAFSTISSGGFSTKQSGLSFWKSTYIENITIFFMLIAGTNFSLLYFTLNGNWRKIIKNEEFRWYLLFIFFVSIIIGLGYYFSTNSGLLKSLHEAIFQVVSIVSTTGYKTNFTYLGSIFTIVFVLIYFIGASSGSTSGGIKISRIVILFKNSYNELVQLMHPNAVISLRMNKNATSSQLVTNALTFVFFYVAIFFIGTIAIMLTITDFGTSVGIVAASLGNIGASVGDIGPSENYYYLPIATKWIASFLMVLGRLELFAVFVLFSPSFWKK